MSVAENIIKIKKDLPANVKLVAVSKFHTADTVREAYDTGHRIFGESRMQELSEKHQQLPDDIEWHFIGHLQTNKVKAIIPYTHTIHSVDSWKLFAEIEKQAAVFEKPICCLLEVHIAKEDSKYGFSFNDCRQFMEQGEWKKHKYAYIGGLMAMATNTEDETLIRKEFKNLKSFFDELKANYFSEDDSFSEISMGMSGDYKIAVEEGSTMVRIGSSIFGNREY
ncbi:YggS family pyridoxal phosphate-dependent enzyme [Dysgonomonas sp. ZJ279]|uniref:YggS family pyridoxal phosphate-dependent enzyme n=1 Tax=Dysgonomonas sp. ZJ279 TaxID=2709796 RepID=UPI0013ED2F2F|nr:YggS family pyridoxal phosphate-dependent enzyme [Dysgonomonas sp. ZJ279]